MSRKNIPRALLIACFAAFPTAACVRGDAEPPSGYVTANGRCLSATDFPVLQKELHLKNGGCPDGYFAVPDLRPNARQSSYFANPYSVLGMQSGSPRHFMALLREEG